MTLLFIDTNVVIYAAGRPHPLKGPCQEILQLLEDHPEAFMTSVEILQELLHRFISLKLWHDGGRSAFAAFSALVRERVESINERDVTVAATLADSHPDLSARDLLHIAVMKRLGLTHIISVDTDFDAVPEITRLDPVKVSDWRRSLLRP
jgi:predicted nucleic acid-binding protein